MRKLDDLVASHLEQRLLDPERLEDVVRGVTIDIQNKEIVAVIGHNGAGKSGVALLDKARVRKRTEEVIALFPSLQPHLRQKAGTLLGGQKQLLALGTALILAPRLLLLDEPSLGLAPALVEKVLGHIRVLSQEFGIAALVVEQKVREVLRIADRVLVLRNGRISFSGAAELLNDEDRLREVYL